MAIRPAQVPGLPDGVEVRRSDRRKRSVSAYRENGQTVVVVPARMSIADAAKYARSLHERLAKKAARTTVSDAQLAKRADELRRQYLPEVPAPPRISWSSRQTTLWGSCTTSEQTIRISERMRGMPSYVLDDVLIHELAHLLFADHGLKFKELVARHPHHERAEAFLAGVEFARTNHAETSTN